MPAKTTAQQIQAQLHSIHIVEMLDLEPLPASSFPLPAHPAARR